jgi:DNA processing protein
MIVKDRWTTEDILTLYYLPKVNSATIYKLVQSYNTLDEILHSELPPQLKMLLNQVSFGSDILSDAKSQANEQVEKCKSFGVDIITRWHDSYPLLLREIGLPPAVLFVQGRLRQSDSAIISMVGKRECTEYGKKVANDFAGFFAKNDFIVCSGMARGIDTYAHKGSLKAGGITYAIIASGIDKLAPYSAKDFKNEIIGAGGAVISEYPCGESAKIAYFPQRNRLISGIAKATIVVESDIKGGGLITAKFAWEQNREVYAVPGKIHTKESAGTNNLILQQRAKPALSPEMVLEDLGYLSVADEQQSMVFEKPKSDYKFNEDEKKIIEVIGHEPVHVDEIAVRSGMSISSLLVNLLSLEMNNIVKPMPGNYYSTL